MLRRSPAEIVLHQHRRHAVVLRELIYYFAPLARSRRRGRHRAERVQNSEVPCVWYLDRSDREDVRLHQPRCANAPLLVYEGTWTHSPLSLLCITMILRVRRKILKLLRSPTVASELGLCVDVICTSRTQVSCGRYKSYCLPACHTLVQRHCEMKRPGPTLRVRLRETGSLDMLCTQMACGRHLTNFS